MWPKRYALSNRTSPNLFAKFGTFGLGVFLKKSIDYGFDYLAYPVALISFGYLWGGVVMTVLSVGLNLAVIRAYDWAKQDFLLLETLKGLQASEEDGRLHRLVVALLRRGNLVAFFLLSWVEDPIVVTLYLRKGTHLFNGLSRRDWLIFIASTLVSNLFWIVSVASVLEILSALFS
jgi:hypothetical protein